MGKAVYPGIDDAARKLKKTYLGLDDTAHKLKIVYLGVEDKARMVYTSYTPVTGLKLTWGDVSIDTDYNDTTEAYMADSTVSVHVETLPADATNQTVTISMEKNKYAANKYTDIRASGPDANGDIEVYAFTSTNNNSTSYNNMGGTLTITAADGQTAKLKFTMTRKQLYYSKNAWTGRNFYSYVISSIMEV